MTDGAKHASVLLEESIAALLTDLSGKYVDGTAGRAGHSRAILQQLDSGGKLLALDKDPQAIAACAELAASDARIELVHSSFADLENLLQERGLAGNLDGILLDLGVSSPQLDQAERGFSFLKDGPLDMRMNSLQEPSAAQWINSASETEIANVLYQFGEERHSRRMARAIVAERAKQEIVTTGRLAEIVKQANPAWERDKHPATRAFQGIRIFINKELQELEAVLPQALDGLRIGGRLVVISFHSLEDRMVKNFIARQVKGDDYPRDMPIPASMLNPKMKSLGKAVKASAAEVALNPRSRSAVMRVAEKIA